MRVFVVEPPEPVISLAEAKDHLRVTNGREDAIITGFVAAATAHIDGPDGWLGRAIGVQTLEARFDVFEAGEALQLCCPPVIELISVQWLDAKRKLQTGDIATLTVAGLEVYADTNAPAWSGCYVGRDALRIRYRAGYETLPPAIRAAILLMVGDLYRNRDTVAAVQASSIPMSTSVNALLGPLRVYA